MDSDYDLTRVGVEIDAPAAPGVDIAGNVVLLTLLRMVTVVGAGSWGTAFATIPASNGIDTIVWARRQDLADAITTRHECPDYLPGVPLPPSLRGTHDLEEALSRAQVVVMAIPSHAFREVLRDVVSHVSTEASMIR